MIMQKHLGRSAVIWGALMLAPLFVQAPAARGAQQSQQPSYTMPEYNQFTNCQSEKDLTAKTKCLDAFVIAYPHSTLMQYVDEMYYQTYYQLKNYAKCIEYADKLVALDQADIARRAQASQVRVQLFPYAFNPKAPDAQKQLTSERDAAAQGVKILQAFKATPNAKLTDAQYKNLLALFYASAGLADFQLKDNAAAIEAFKSALENNPADAVSEYRLGLAYLGTTPPQSLDGFWALARAISLKVPDADKVKDFLRKSILSYEQPGCDSQVDPQLSELLQLAANAPTRPSTYTIPSHDDLTKISASSTIVSVLSDLSAGGDKAKMTWLAVCGAEFPQVVGKIIDVQKTDTTADFMVFTSASADEMQAATTANMDVKVWIAPPPAGATTAQVTPQPNVVRLQKEDEIRFSGTITSYDPSPFLLHWDQVTVDPSIIPEKSAPGKRAPHRIPSK